LYSYTDNRASINKILVTAAYGGVQIQVEDKDNFPENLQKHPLASVRTYDSRWPVLVTSSGPIWQTHAIARYVAKIGSDSSQLLGSTPYQEGLITQWIDFLANELYLPVAAWIYPILGLLETTEQEKEIARVSTLKQFHILDNFLRDNTFLVGERVSLADILVSLTIYDVYCHVLDESLVKGYRNLTRWFLTLINQDHFQSVIGTPHFLAHDYVRSLGVADHEGHATEAPQSPQSQSPSSQHRAVAKRHAHHVAASTTNAIEKRLTEKPVYKKLTLQDLEQKAMPSQYHPPGATKEKPHLHSTAPPVLRSLQQPR